MEMIIFSILNYVCCEVGMAYRIIKNNWLKIIERAELLA
jgi:hypothetical protein